MQKKQYSILTFMYCIALLSNIATADDAINIDTTNTNSQTEGPITWGWNATLASKYLWQGFDYSDDGIVLQPEAYIAINNFSATLWFNHDIDTNKSDEFDLYLQYDWTFTKYALSAGYAYYEYPQNKPQRDDWDPSQELYLDISIDSTLTPSLSMHYDFDAGKGAYYAIGIGHEYEVAAKNLMLAANIFYHDDYYDASGIPSIEINASTSFNTKSMTITPSVSYFHTWENGDFKGINAIPDAWLFSINVARDY